MEGVIYIIAVALAMMTINIYGYRMAQRRVAALFDSLDGVYDSVYINGMQCSPARVEVSTDSRFALFPPRTYHFRALCTDHDEHWFGFEATIRDLQVVSHRLVVLTEPPQFLDSLSDIKFS